MATRVSRDRYRHFGFGRVDLEPAVGNVKRHVREVAVRVCELVSGQTHRVGAHIRSRRFRGAVVREVSRRVTYTFGGNRYIIPINGLFASVIRYGAIVSRNRHNHFVRDRRDFQLAFGRGNRIVDRLRIAVQLVGERVLALANVRLRARHLVRRAFAFNKAVAAYRHLVVRQRIAVVDLLVRSRGQRHRALADYELAVSRLRNDILSCRVNRVNRTIRKRCRICSDIRSRRANFNRAEISVFRRTGKAGNALLLSIISLRLAVRLQLDVLIIVEIDLVLSLDDLNRLLFIRFRRNCVAFNRGGGCLHRFPERLAVKGLGSRNLLGRPVPVIVHRIAQVVPLTINNRHSRIFGQRSVHNSPIRRITGDNRRIYRVPCAMV